MLRITLQCVTNASDMTRLSHMRNISRVIFMDKSGIKDTYVSD